MILREAVSDADYAGFGALIAEYVAWCRERYASDPWLVDMPFSHQSLDRELVQLPVSFGPPKGSTLVALDGDEIIGGVAFRVIAPGTCEMKRMYVRKSAAGQGVGRRLCLGLLDLAKAHGLSKMVLDTSRDMIEAIRLYRSCGFTDCAPYIDYPERMKPMMLFMEKALEAAK